MHTVEQIAIEMDQFVLTDLHADAVHIVDADLGHLQVRFYDEPGKYRCWNVPRDFAKDLVRWWGSVGHAFAASGRRLPEKEFGMINVALLSPTQVYFRGRTPLGRPNVTGFQLPRAAVEVLAARISGDAANSARQ